MNLSFHFSGIMSKSTIAGSYGKCVFSKQLSDYFPEGLCYLHSHQQCASEPVSPQPRQQLELSLIFILATRRGKE